MNNYGKREMHFGFPVHSVRNFAFAKRLPNLSFAWKFSSKLPLIVSLCVSDGDQCVFIVLTKW